MNNVYIVGAGGYGRVVLDQLLRDNDRDHRWRIVGFLDERKNALDNHPIHFPIVGNPFYYIPSNKDLFICALGSPTDRKHYAAQLLAKGAKFMNILTEVYAGSNLKMGQGVFFERGVRVGPDCTLGDFVQLHSMSILGHDVEVGDYSQISCFSFIGGGVNIGIGVTVYPHSCILPGLKIGDEAVIGAGSVIIRDVPAGVTMFGNPAKRLAGP